MNYAPRLPKDLGGESLQEFAFPKTALARYTSENALASSVISLTHNTTAVDVAAVGANAFVKWVTTGDTTASVIGIAGATSNYDAVVPAGQVRRFAVPIETAGVTNASVQGINRAYGLYQRIAVKTPIAASVLTVEY